MSNAPETSEKVIEALVRHGCFAADHEVIAAGPGLTGADETRIAINAAVRMLLDNGLIQVNPPDSWPAWVLLDRWKTAGGQR